MQETALATNMPKCLVGQAWLWVQWSSAQCPLWVGGLQSAMSFHTKFLAAEKGKECIIHSYHSNNTIMQCKVCINTYLCKACVQLWLASYNQNVQIKELLLCICVQRKMWNYSSSTVPTGTPTRLTGTKSEFVMPGNKASLCLTKLAWPLLKCVWLCRVLSVVQNYSNSECGGNSP